MSSANPTTTVRRTSLAAPANAEAVDPSRARVTADLLADAERRLGQAARAEELGRQAAILGSCVGL
jgi:hypothetical protein